MNWEVAAEPLPLPKISAPPDSSPCALPSLNKQISFRTSQKKKKRIQKLPSTPPAPPALSLQTSTGVFPAGFKRGEGEGRTADPIESQRELGLTQKENEGRRRKGTGAEGWEEGGKRRCPPAPHTYPGREAERRRVPARRLREREREGERRGKKPSERGRRRAGGWMEGVTQMAKPRLWPARSHPRASYMSAGASWPRRRRRAGARRAGGRASQSRRPTPPPTAPPAPDGAGPGGRGADPLLRPLPPPAASSPGSAVGAFPARALHAPVGRGRRNRGVPAGCLGRGGEDWGGKGSAPGGGSAGGGARARGCAAAGMRGAGGWRPAPGRRRRHGPPTPPERGTAGRSPARSLMASR